MYSCDAGSMMHIHAAFQILKEMLKHGETQTIKSVQDDNGSQVSSESTVVKTLQVKVSDLQYQVFSEPWNVEPQSIVLSDYGVFCFF